MFKIFRKPGPRGRAWGYPDPIGGNWEPPPPPPPQKILETKNVKLFGQNFGSRGEFIEQKKKKIRKIQNVFFRFPPKCARVVREKGSSRSSEVRVIKN